MADGYEIIKLGLEGQPLVIIDDFAKDPDALKLTAQDHTFTGGGRFYPGVRAPADYSYLNDRGAMIREIFTKVFDCPNGIEITESNYSLVTTQSAQLQPIQSLPHFDGFNPNVFAILHYLSVPEMGGTAFYRHKATDFETITQDRFETYKAALESEVAEDGLPSGYFQNSDRFEPIYEVEARYNRLVIYRGMTLHCGVIPPDFVPSTNPNMGRLTINIFCQKG